MTHKRKGPRTLRDALAGFVPTGARGRRRADRRVRRRADGRRQVPRRQLLELLSLNASTNNNGGACQLWRSFPTADGGRASRSSTAASSSPTIARTTSSLNPSPPPTAAPEYGSSSPTADGWSRLQLKRSGRYLDAADCSNDLRINGKSAAPVTGPANRGGWFPTPTAGRPADRYRVGRDPRGAPVPHGPPRRLRPPAGGPGAPESDQFAVGGQTYTWYREGWNGPGFYVVGSHSVGHRLRRRRRVARSSSP